MNLDRQRVASLAQWFFRSVAAAALLSSLAALPVLAHGEACGEKAAQTASGDQKAAAPRSFASKPKPGTQATCAVSGEVFKVTAKTKMVQEGGRWYPFCCNDCINDFKASPAKYTEPPKS